jgi:hypothetical protein
MAHLGECPLGLGDVFQALETSPSQQAGERVEHHDAQPDQRASLLPCHAILLALIVRRSLPCRQIACSSGRQRGKMGTCMWTCSSR